MQKLGRKLIYLHLIKDLWVQSGASKKNTKHNLTDDSISH